MNCKACQIEIPEMLADLNSQAASVLAAQTHLASCSACQKEFAAFQNTFALLDDWKAPEPSPYFDQKLAVLLREEIAKPRTSWLERLQAHLLFNTGRQLRPALAGVLALALLLGGGTFAGISTFVGQPHGTQVSAAVDDLQILDRNDQALQQMEQLLQEESGGDTALPPPIS